MNFPQYISKRIPEIKVSHPHLITHKQRIGLIFSEWQLKLRKELRDKILNEDKIKDSKAISIYKSQKYKQIINDLELDSVQNWTQDEENQLIDEMSQVIGTHPETIRFNQKNSGGAQYVFKKQDWKLWDKIYKDSTNLYDMLLNFQKKYPISPGEIQFWTAEMWSILWNMWYAGYKTKVVDELNFSWATDDIQKYESNPIFHLAGITERDKNTRFFKADFINKNPLESLKENINFFDYVDKNNATHKYIENMKSLLKKQQG